MKVYQKVAVVFCVCLLLLLLISNSFVLAEGNNPAINAMSSMNGNTDDNSNITGTLGKIINAAIALIQIVGTGISLIMVTILGIKYILASPSDKADVKKQITPMLIGAIVLFGSVNIVQLVANFTADLFE